ncbi:MAG: tetratricopeptide repeat protein [Polyangiaceae bacterium]|nr:tetratricopeptide repeat protein [Polyangiaceae bacterium]
MSEKRGQEQAIEWVMIGMDPKLARKQGMPTQIPIPKSEFENLADKGLNVDQARAWTKAFMAGEIGQNAQWRKKNNQLAAQLDGFVDKGPVWERAQKAFQERDFEKALQQLKRIKSLDSDDHMAIFNMGSAQANTGDFAGALKSFKTVRPTFEGDPEFHVTVGQVHMALKDNDSAINEMVLALEAKPDHQPALDALERLGVLTAIYENPRDAGSLLYVRADSVKDYLTGLWAAEPRDLGYYLEQLAYHERENRFEVALAAAEQAIAVAGDAGSVRAETAKITALRALGRNEEALAAAEVYASKNPTCAPALVELARSLGAVGRVDEGRAAVDKALAIDPGDQIALLARFWPAKTDDIAAVQACLPALQEFVETHDQSAGAWRSLARAYLVVGRTEEGINLLAKAVELAPNDEDLRAEHWTELRKQLRYQEIIDLAEKLGNMKDRDWQLRWNEAEAYFGLQKTMEARALFTAINSDERLHVDIRKKAKRTVRQLDMGPAVQMNPGQNV